MADEKRTERAKAFIVDATATRRYARLDDDGSLMITVMADFASIEVAAERTRPVDMLLWCPQCFEQHVDEAKPDVCELCGHAKEQHFHRGEPSVCCLKCTGVLFTAWLNPPHKSHRCNFCNHVWRPSDRPTNGVLKLETSGNADGSAKPVAFANGADFDEAVKIATQQLRGNDNDGTK